MVMNNLPKPTPTDFSRWDLLREETEPRFCPRPSSVYLVVLGALTCYWLHCYFLTGPGLGLNKSILCRDTFRKGKTIKKSEEWRTQKMGWQFPDGGGGIAIRWAQERLLIFNTVTYMAGIHVLIFLTVHMFYKNLLYVWYIHFTI